MRKIFIKFFFMTVFVIFGVLKSHSQYIIAGQHDSGCYFYDINPDTTIIGPNNHPPVSLPPAVYRVDINGDGFDDVFFYSRGWWINGTGWSESCLKIYDTNFCQVALGHIDSCYTNDGSTLLSTTKMMKFLKKNDTINRNLTWLNKTQYLTYTNWTVYDHYCTDNGFNDDTTKHYLAVRLLSPGIDTLYGWIKVTNVQFLTVTIEEFACRISPVTIVEEFPVLVEIFPNPASTIVQIETLWSEYDLTVYNQYGIEIIKKSRITDGWTWINLSERNSGIYFFRFVSGDHLLTKKVIKL